MHIVGVRHHSPACCRAVLHVLDEVRPARILIEGPSDFNSRLAELVGLEHRLPVAMFHHRATELVASHSFTPFCESSPEWQALRWARDHEVEARFMDLPSHARAFFTSENRTADRVDRYGVAMRALAERLGLDGSDAVWDHLFEQPSRPEQLVERLAAYFAELRSEQEVADDSDLCRERFMARCLAWAAAQGGEVVAICGGYHKPALQRLLQQAPAEQDWPAAPRDPAVLRAGTYLVPWSFPRMDSFSGYAAGMPSPGWYQALHEHGPELGAREMVARAIAVLRSAGVPVSVSDRIAVEITLQGLMAVRSHEVPARTDVLDALCSGLIKEGLDAPPPWTRRGGIQPGTDSRLVKILGAFCGTREGAISAETPLPPLVQDVEEELARCGIQLASSPQEHRLDLDEPGGLSASRVLHRLALLGIPGVRRLRGPADPGSSTREEWWALSRAPRALPALLEASHFGATLGEAAQRCLQEQLKKAAGLKDKTRLLMVTLFIGLEELAQGLLESLHEAVATERDLAGLGGSVRVLMDLWRFDHTFVGQGREQLRGLLVALLGACLRAFELAAGGGPSPGRQEACAALRDLLLYGPVDPEERSLAMALFRRRAAEATAPLELRGAALGLWGLDEPEIGTQARRVLSDLGDVGLGDWLAGLFSVTRQTLGEDDDLLAAIDGRLSAMTLDRFLAALPALREAFRRFPAPERMAIGGRIAGIHGAAEQVGRGLATTAVSPAALERGVRLDAETTSVLRRYGLEGA